MVICRRIRLSECFLGQRTFSCSGGPCPNYVSEFWLRCIVRFWATSASILSVPTDRIGPFLARSRTSSMHPGPVRAHSGDYFDGPDDPRSRPGTGVRRIGTQRCSERQPQSGNGNPCCFWQWTGGSARQCTDAARCRPRKRQHPVRVFGHATLPPSLPPLQSATTTFCRRQRRYPGTPAAFTPRAALAARPRPRRFAGRRHVTGGRGPQSVRPGAARASPTAPLRRPVS